MNSTVVYVAGVFDLFHRGHVELFRRARALGDSLVVAVNSDDMTATYKRRPIVSQEDRLEIVKACRFVDHAFIIDGYDNRPFILEYKVKKIVHGDDWTGDGYLQQLRLTPEFVVEHQVEVIYVPYWKGVSTSQVLTDVANRHVARTHSVAAVTAPVPIPAGANT